MKYVKARFGVFKVISIVEKIQSKSTHSLQNTNQKRLACFSELHDKATSYPPYESPKDLKENVKSKILRATLAAIFLHKMNFSNNRKIRPKPQP